MKVLYLGLMTNSSGFAGAFKRGVEEYRQLSSGVPNFNTRACEIALEFNPDLIFIQIQTPNIITEECVKKLKETGAFVINWTGDVRTPIPKWYYDIGKHIDLTCFSNMTDVLQFREDGLKSEYLEIGYDPEIYKPEGKIIPTKEIVFMGNNYGPNKFPLSKYRIEMVEFLKKNYPNQFAFYGNGWNFSFGDWNSSQPNESAVYRGAKIAINLSHFDYERYNSDRILRILGTGTAICLAKNYKGIEEDYLDGEHLAVWNDFKELKALIDFYLKYPETAKDIVKDDLELVKKEHSYDAMIKNIIKLCE